MLPATHTAQAVRTALYARVSTADKDQEPETQLAPLRDFAHASGLTVIGEYIDYASAQDDRRRSQWRRLLEDASRRKLDQVLIWKIDRAFRSVADASRTLAELRRWGVGLRSYTEAWIDTGSAAGEMMFNLLATFAQFERALIAERVRAGMARAKAQGKHVGRPRIINGEWEQLAPRIRSGEVSRRAAARLLGCSRASVQRYLRAS
jgi:DNA invertase Pin-like site-specific DNA recombinase